jgi:uncharacterized protein
VLLVSAIIFGFLGSLHCLGMCAPLLWAIPDNQANKKRWLITKVLYNSGRLVTYSLLGLLIGLIGESFQLFGLQQHLSWITGLFLLLGLALSYKGYLITKNTKLGFRLNAKLRTMLSQYMTKQGLSSHLIFGLLNGLLPCGLVYMALLASVSMGSALGGASYMAIFGLGTFPMMFLAAYMGSSFKKMKKINVNKLAPKLVFLVAILLIIRGLNLGIPYLSPRISSPDQITICTTS